MSTDINDIIQHDGIVQEIVNDSILVRITSVSACSGCHSHGACNMVAKENKIVRISGKYPVRQGDEVTVIMKKSMGYLAVLLSYVLPFFLVIASLFVMNAMSVPELTSGILSIGVLLPYYLIIYLFRNRINQEFTFTLKNLNTI
jgi:sigma-E factor negative regulatory protein RseC